MNSNLGKMLDSLKEDLNIDELISHFERYENEFENCIESDGFSTKLVRNILNSLYDIRGSLEKLERHNEKSS